MHTHDNIKLGLQKKPKGSDIMKYQNIEKITTGYEHLSDEELLIGKSGVFENEYEFLISDNSNEYYEDFIDGDNHNHAIERAKRNWECIVLARM